MTAKMLSEKLNQHIVNVSSSICKLVQRKEINFIEVDWKVAREVFGYDKITRKTRIFFSKNISVTSVFKELKISKGSFIHSDLF